MSKTIASFALAALFAVVALPSLAAKKGEYSFQVRITDGKTGLTANPKFAELKMPEEQVAKAAKDSVMLFDNTTGTAWNWLMLSWVDKEPQVEQYVNAQGAAAKETGDVGLSAGTAHSVRVRCLKGNCRISGSDANGKRSLKSLQNGETAEFKPDSSIKVSVQPR